MEKHLTEAFTFAMLLKEVEKIEGLEKNTFYDTSSKRFFR